MNISVIIPTYKKKELLLRNLEHNVPLFDGQEIIIVNDDPEDSIKNDVAKWPQIKLIENTENKGFSGTMNVGVLAARGDYCIFLNSDVMLHDRSYEKALPHFQKDPRLFAVSFAQIEQDGQTVGKNRIYWANGFFHHDKAYDLTFGINGWAEGGACMVDKKKYNELSGFDEQYSPFYWEDIDLSYRAWKKSYSVFFDPEILVEHHHESTIGSLFSKKSIKRIAYRNQLLFIWTVITDPDLIKEHNAALMKLVLKSLLTDWSFVIGFLQALGTIKPAKNQHFIKTDHEILAQFDQ